MKFTKLFIILLFLMISAGAVSAYDSNDTSQIMNESSYTFTDLENDINASGDVFNVEHDYAFSNESDSLTRSFERDNFTINGKGHVLDGKGQSRIFSIKGENITINDLVFANANYEYSAALGVWGSATLNNVTFINCTVPDSGSVYVDAGMLNCFGCRFIDYSGDSGSAIDAIESSLNIVDSYFTSGRQNNRSAISAAYCDVNVDRCLFFNSTSRYACGIYAEFSNLIVNNSRFSNLRAKVSAGAISVKNFNEVVVENTTFVNATSKKNGGAILADGCDVKGMVSIDGCDFIDCSSDFGGAVLQLEGYMSVAGCSFQNNTAGSVAGAIYTSFVDLDVINSTFEANGAGNFSTIYSERGIISIFKSNFTGNDPDVWAIGLSDFNASIQDSIFENGRFNIYGEFMLDCFSEGNVIDNSTISIDNENYVFYVQNSALPLNIVGNVINLSSYPSRFDLRDWGWESPVKDQGHMGVCWAFSTIEALETALNRATGIQYNLSVNNLKDFPLRYSKFGNILYSEGTNAIIAWGYALSWNGLVFEEEDEYDEMGKVSGYVETGNRIHLQDMLIIFPRSMDYVLDVKRALLNYGAVSISYDSDEDYFNEETSAHYVNETAPPDHGVAIIGWDDNYSADNFLITPPGNGAWIVKNNWGSQWGDGGYFYLSYYEGSLFYAVPGGGEIMPFMVYIFENPISYHINYPTDFTGMSDFDNNFSQCSNEYEAVSDDLIAAVGTYFWREGVEYSFDIYVNGRMVHSQSGISDFAGYRTIILNRYISVESGDRFRVVFKSDMISYQTNSRIPVAANVSMASADGKVWTDLSDVGGTACLKAYTVTDEGAITDNKDIAADYSGGKYFSVKITASDGVIVSGASVTFTINKRTVTQKTGSDGIAKIKITDALGSYKITAAYNGKQVKNTVTVKHVLTASKVTVKKTAKKFTLKATLKINGKPVKGKTVAFTFKGKTYKVKTNSKGVAQKALKKNVIKKLKKGKTYTVKVTYLKDTIKTAVKVR